MNALKLSFFTIFCFLNFASLGQSDIKKPNLKDDIILDDLIIDGSSCVGSGCVDGELFGMDTQRYKEDNLRLHFEDTSSENNGFPYKDWRININETHRFGRNVFFISDESNEIFSMEAGAPRNAIYIKQNSNTSVEIGFGTTDPEESLHAVKGNTPALRLEQDGSNGFTTQTWDLGGNEAEFFIRDVTGGSELPFRVKPGAPDNAIYISAEGKIGLGTDNPQYDLHLEGDLGMTGGIYGVSDARLKEETQKLENAMSLINGLQPKKYQFKNQYDQRDRQLPKGQHYGFFAQELKEVIPDLVTVFDQTVTEDPSEGPLLSINYVELIPILVKGMQELQDEVKRLELIIEQNKNN